MFRSNPVVINIGRDKAYAAAIARGKSALNYFYERKTVPHKFVPYAGKDIFYFSGDGWEEIGKVSRQTYRETRLLNENLEEIINDLVNCNGTPALWDLGGGYVRHKGQ